MADQRGGLGAREVVPRSPPGVVLSVAVVLLFSVMSDNDGVPADNPAGRLFHILTDANRQGKMPLRQMWAAVLGVEMANTAEWLRRFVHVIELAQEAEARAKSIDETNNENHLRAFNAIRTALAETNFTGPASNFQKHLNADVMARLELCALALSRYSREKAIPEDQLSDLQASVEGLIETLLSEVRGLEEEVKLVLIQKLEEVRRAIMEYRIRGADGIKGAYEGLWGSLVLHNDELKEHSGASWSEKLRNVMVSIQVALTTAEKIPKVLPAAKELIKGLLEAPQ